MPYQMKKIIPYLLFIVFTVIGCEEPESPPKTSDFDSPEEFIKNPDIKEAEDESGITFYYGDNPPALVGEYSTDGEVTKTSPELVNMISFPINSTFCLYNQTSSGLISFTESIMNIKVGGAGGYITGESGKFTIWGESRQNGEEAGLPDELTITVALIMSGQKLNGGDLIAKGLTVVTEVEGMEDYEELTGIWWMWEAYFFLEGSCTGY